LMSSNWAAVIRRLPRRFGLQAYSVGRTGRQPRPLEV
jgi:hypothetical protein